MSMCIPKKFLCIDPKSIVMQGLFRFCLLTWKSPSERSSPESSWRTEDTPWVSRPNMADLHVKICNKMLVHSLSVLHQALYCVHHRHIRTQVKINQNYIKSDKDCNNNNRHRLSHLAQFTLMHNINSLKLNQCITNIFIVVVHEGRTWPHKLKTHLALDPISDNQQLVLQWNTTMGIFKSTV